jgi:hypothetical protein
MTIRSDDSQTGKDRPTKATEGRKEELEEAEEIRERGALTPEARKQGVTSHLPVEKTEAIYRSGDNNGAANGGADRARKNFLKK